MNGRCTWLSSLLLLLLWSTGQSVGQIVSIEDHRLELDSTKWNGTATFNFYNTRNINRIFTLSTGSDIQYVTGKHKILSTNEFRLIVNADSDGGSDENRGYQHLRYNYAFDSTFTYEAFVQVQTDQVLRIGTRVLLGTGGRITFLKNDKGFFHLGLTYMYEYEQERGNEVYHRDHRMSSYISLNKKLGKNVRIDLVAYYQPLFTDFSDYRFSNGMTFILNISERFSFNLALELNYDANPVEDEEIDPLTYSISNGLTVKF